MGPLPCKGRKAYSSGHKTRSKLSAPYPRVSLLPAKYRPALGGGGLQEGRQGRRVGPLPPSLPAASKISAGPGRRGVARGAALRPHRLNMKCGPRGPPRWPTWAKHVEFGRCTTQKAHLKALFVFIEGSLRSRCSCAPGGKGSLSRRGDADARKLKVFDCLRCSWASPEGKREGHDTKHVRLDRLT